MMGRARRPGARENAGLALDSLPRGLRPRWDTAPHAPLWLAFINEVLLVVGPPRRI